VSTLHEMLISQCSNEEHNLSLTVEFSYSTRLWVPMQNICFIGNLCFSQTCPQNSNWRSYKRSQCRASMLH